jgi:hypothetical protein
MLIKYKCGCDSNKIRCPEAVKLWAIANTAFYSQEWDAYQIAFEKYNQHFIKNKPEIKI